MLWFITVLAVRVLFRLLDSAIKAGDLATLAESRSVGSMGVSFFLFARASEMLLTFCLAQSAMVLIVVTLTALRWPLLIDFGV